MLRYRACNAETWWNEHWVRDSRCGGWWNSSGSAVLSWPRWIYDRNMQLPKSPSASTILLPSKASHHYLLYERWSSTIFSWYAFFSSHPPPPNSLFVLLFPKTGGAFQCDTHLSKQLMELISDCSLFWIISVLQEKEPRRGTAMQKRLCWWWRNWRLICWSFQYEFSWDCRDFINHFIQNFCESHFIWREKGKESVWVNPIKSHVVHKVSYWPRFLLIEKLNKRI